MTKHKHADLMLKYAIDAGESMTPWDRWEHLSVGDAEWAACLTHPLWHSLHQYRRVADYCKVTINGVLYEFKKPTPVGDKHVFNVTAIGVIKLGYMSENAAEFHANFEDKVDAENYANIIRLMLGETK